MHTVPLCRSGRIAADSKRALNNSLLLAHIRPVAKHCCRGTKCVHASWHEPRRKLATACPLAAPSVLARLSGALRQHGRGLRSTSGRCGARRAQCYRQQQSRLPIRAAISGNNQTCMRDADTRARCAGCSPRRGPDATEVVRSLGGVVVSNGRLSPNMLEWAPLRTVLAVIDAIVPLPL